MLPDDPKAFATWWVDAWNRRELEVVLAAYAEQVVFSSLTAARVVPASGGVVRGKDALRDYWTRALAGNPDLHFELSHVYAGADAVVVQYVDQNGRHVAETMVFADGLVVAGHASVRLPHDGGR